MSIESPLSRDSENKKEVSDPDEIRTHYPRRVKASDCGFGVIQTHLELKQHTTLNDFWLAHKEEFNTWLQFREITPKTKQTYMSSLTRFFEKNKINKPKDVRNFQLKDKESRGLRNLFNYCEDEEIEDVVGHNIEKWRRFIKIKKSGVVEIYVNDEEIQEAYEACSDDLKPIYQLLVIQEIDSNIFTKCYRTLMKKILL